MTSAWAHIRAQDTFVRRTRRTWQIHPGVEFARSPGRIGVVLEGMGREKSRESTGRQGEFPRTPGGGLPSAVLGFRR